MEKSQKKRIFTSAFMSWLIAALLFLLIAVVAVRGINSADEVNRTEQIRTLRDNVRRAIVTCYAMEGSYPESLEYMRENYGVNYDERKFNVYYSIFASNIMPDYDVIAIVR
ncbi:MAG: hypothetical protein LBN43_01110 [Oscillospiraceae bacterium]|jgi:hypothetical protein|nr:hypothetical protein [Oscillospiraceae bacterium]